MNEKIKHLIKKKKAIFQKQKESNTVDRPILSNITLELSNAIMQFLKLNTMKDLQLNVLISKQLRKPTGQF